MAGAMTLRPLDQAGHEMRLDQVRGNTQIRVDEAAVEFDRGSARRSDVKIDMLGGLGLSSLAVSAEI
jgi:hypothetical protein